MSIACLYVYVYVGVMFIWSFLIAQHVQLAKIYIFQYDDVPGNCLEQFATVVNVGVWCGLCCMLVENKNAQGKFNPIKSRTIPPKYHKLGHSVLLNRRCTSFKCKRICGVYFYWWWLRILIFRAIFFCDRKFKTKLKKTIREIKNKTQYGKLAHEFYIIFMNM